MENLLIRGKLDEVEESADAKLGDNNNPSLLHLKPGERLMYPEPDEGQGKT